MKNGQITLQETIKSAYKNIKVVSLLSVSTIFSIKTQKNEPNALNKQNQAVFIL